MFFGYRVSLLIEEPTKWKKSKIATKRTLERLCKLPLEVLNNESKRQTYRVVMNFQYCSARFAKLYAFLVCLQYKLIKLFLRYIQLSKLRHTRKKER